MTDVVMTPSKRPRGPSFAEKHRETHTATIDSDWFQEKGKEHETKHKTFLELCSFCKKRLRPNADVFMYGYLGAFCSEACRTKQMAYDIFIEKSREIATAKKGRTCSGIKRKEDEPLDHRPPRFYI